MYWYHRLLSYRLAESMLGRGVLLGAGLVGVAALFLRSLRRRALSSTDKKTYEKTPAYAPPAWVPTKSLKVLPTSRLSLAHLPTPLHAWPLPRTSTEMWIKRDDCTGCELSGNKVRKLEFLLAVAVDGQHDSVITVGGIQSNHCRATAAAARRVGGLEPHIILRTSKPDEDPGFVGNLMIDRMVPAILIIAAPHDTTQTPHGTTQHNTRRHHTTPDHTAQYHTTQHHSTPHPTPHHPTPPNRTTPHHTTPHHTTPHHTTSSHSTAQHTTPNHTTLQHNAPHHTTLRLSE